MGLLRRRYADTGAQAEFGWAPLVDYPDPIYAGRPDKTNQLPRVPVGILERSVGYQLFNGVAYLDPGWNVPTASGVPYWQTRAVQNPPQYTANGGTAQNPMNGAVAARLAARTAGAQPSGSIGGPGQIAPGVSINGE